MIRTSLLASSALGLACLAAPAAAAPCVTDGAAILCGAPGSDPVASDVDDVSVIVGEGADVTSDDAATPPVALGGDNAALVNDGLIDQTSADEDGYAITGAGEGLTVTNRGTIRSGDRGIEMLAGSGLAVVNEAGATIEARRQAVRSEEDVPGAYVENAGTITASEGRAVQVRSFSATVVNSGDLRGGEEVVEARGDFTLINSGTIRLVDETVEDEDGVQFASGEVINSGLIRGTDDGIDADEGLIRNEAGGRIVSLAPDANDNSGIDVDEVYEDEINPVRPSGPLRIVNAGLIEGPSAIGTAETSASRITIENSGVLRGRGGTAIRLDPAQGSSSLTLGAGSEIYGDVDFGGADDVVTVGADVRALILDGVVDGGAGEDLIDFAGLDLGAVQSFDVSGETADLSLAFAEGLYSGTFRNVESWGFGDETFSTAALEDAVSVAPIPLPAGLPLLTVALGGLAVLRRRR